MKVVFFGASKFVIPILEILRKNYDLALVVTTESASQGDAPSGLSLRVEDLQSYPVIHYATEHRIPYLSIKQFNNQTMKQLQAVRAPLAVLAYFGHILPKSVLNLFPKGILNTHPSLLPKYRGPTPGQTAISNGDKVTGITIIKLDEEVDHGPILAQEEEQIHSTDTAETLYERLFKKGATLLYNSIESYLKGELKPKEQNHSKATFTERLTRDSGYIDPSSFEIGNLKLEIARKIRAYYPWPGVWTKVQIAAANKKRLTTNKSAVSSQTLPAGRQELAVRIKFLPGNLIQVEGKKPMTYKDFLNGYPEAKEFIQKIE